MKKWIYSIVLAIILVPQFAWGQNTSTTSVTKSVRSQLQNEMAAVANTLKEYRSVKGERNQERMKERLRVHTEKMITLRLRAVQLQQERLRKRCGAVNQYGEINRWTLMVQDRLNQLNSELSQSSELEQIKQVTNRIISENHVFIGLLPAVNGACVSTLIISKVDEITSKHLPVLKQQGYDTKLLEGYLAQAKKDAQEAYELYKWVANNLGEQPATLKAKLNQATEKLKSARKNLSLAKEELEKFRANLTQTPVASATATD